MTPLDTRLGREPETLAVPLPFADPNRPATCPYHCRLTWIAPTLAVCECRTVHGWLYLGFGNLEPLTTPAMGVFIRLIRRLLEFHVLPAVPDDWGDEEAVREATRSPYRSHPSRLFDGWGEGGAASPR